MRTQGCQWFDPNLLRGSGALRLICFPYAGGSASAFFGWDAELPPLVQVCPVHLPGRARRIHERLHRRIGPLVLELHEGLRPLFDRPFALFGYSMGALLAFELARALEATHGPQPELLIVAARRAPHMPPTQAPTFNLPDTKFLAELRRLGGTPEGVVADPELLDFYLPVLRCDFELTQTYVYNDGPPLSCPIVAIGGDHDPEVTVDELEGWKEHTRSKCSVRVLEGSHFLLQTRRRDLLREIRRALGCEREAAAL